MTEKKEVRSITSKHRRHFHAVQYKVRKKHGLSRRTVFYMKEYGPHSHVASRIVRESLKVLLLTSIISSIGGIALENIRVTLATILPLIIILPALNDMIGDVGTIVASKFTTALYLGHIRGDWWKIHFLHRTFWIVFTVALITAAYVAAISILLSAWTGYGVNIEVFKKIALIALASTTLLTVIIFNISIVGGLWIYRRGEDPNNFLIPITTAVADFGSLTIFAYLVKVLF